jgi:hypothetical protein
MEGVARGSTATPLAQLDPPHRSLRLAERAAPLFCCGLSIKKVSICDAPHAVFTGARGEAIRRKQLQLSSHVMLLLKFATDGELVTLINEKQLRWHGQYPQRFVLIRVS